MVNDVLSNIKMMLSRYQNVIAETENKIFEKHKIIYNIAYNFI